VTGAVKVGGAPAPRAGSAGVRDDERSDEPARICAARSHATHTAT
jgi:hypothetical protein